MITKFKSRLSDKEKAYSQVDFNRHWVRLGQVGQNHYFYIVNHTCYKKLISALESIFCVSSWEI